MPQYLTGDQWTDDTWRAWAAGFVDRGGSIIARPESGRLSVSVTSRDPWALHAMRDALGVGDIDAHPRIVGLHVWRVRQPEDIRRVLETLLPFLNSRRDAASAALGRIDAVIKQRSERAERNRHILALHEQATFSQVEIAAIVGTTPHIVTNTIARFRRENDITIRARRKGTR